MKKTYEDLRKKFEKAASKHRVDPKVLKKHRNRNRNKKAIKTYWQQPPAE